MFKRITKYNIFYQLPRIFFGFLVAIIFLALLSVHVIPETFLYFLFLVPLMLPIFLSNLKKTGNPAIKNSPWIFKIFFSRYPFFISGFLNSLEFADEKSFKKRFQLFKRLIIIENSFFILSSFAFLILIFVFSITNIGSFNEGLKNLYKFSPLSFDKPVLVKEVDEIFSSRSYTVRPPAYTGKSSSLLKGYKGDFNVLPGTKIDFKAQLIKDVADADSFKVFVNENSHNAKVEGSSLSFSFEVKAATTVVWAAQKGQLLLQEKPIIISIKSDSFPKVEITDNHMSDTIEEADKLDFILKAKDDYGIRDLKLVVETNGNLIEKIDLKTFKSPPLEFESRFLEELNLSELESLAFYVEASDNDELSDFKLSKSNVIRKNVRSKTLEHKQNVNLLFGLRDKLLAILSSALLDSPFSIEVMSSLESFQVEIRGVLRKFSEDLMIDDSTLQGLENLADSLKKLRLLRTKEMAVKELENKTLFIDDLIRRQSMMDASEIMASIEDTQRKIRSLIDEYKKYKSEHLKNKIKRQLAILKAKMNRLLEKLAKLETSIPGDYFNREALKQASMSKSLNNLDNMLENGDIESAMKALSEMEMKLKAMKEMIKQNQSDLGSKEYRTALRKIDHFVETLDEIETSQKTIDKSLSKITEKISKKKQDYIKENGLSATIIKRLDILLSKLADFDSRSIPAGFDLDYEKLKRVIWDALDAAKKKMLLDTHERVLRALRNANDLAERTGYRRGRGAEKFKNLLVTSASELAEIASILEKLLFNDSEFLSPAEKRKMQELSQKQNAVAKKTESLENLMEEIDKEIPVFGKNGKEIQEKLRAGAESASEDLRGLKANPAKKSGEMIMGQLKKLRDSMMNGDKQKGQGQASGMPMPMQGSWSPGKARRKGGKNPFRQSQRVKIPGKDDFKATPEFRDDILKAMRKDIPESVKKEVLDYYNELVK